MKKSRDSYFPGLHALRFFAALFVIFHHLEQYKSWAGYSNAWGENFIDALGHQPVSFFFVLSGFLITYLLLVEHERTNQINVGSFYWRRVLRIWPLYFVIVGAALFIVPLFADVSFDNFQNPLYSTSVIISLLLFLPNVLRLSFPNLVGANQLWSVGIEEQFYLFWPLLVRKFIKKIIPFLIMFIIGKFMVHAGLLLLSTEVSSVRLAQIIQLYKLFPVEQMAIGGLGAAFLFYDKSGWITFLKHPALGVLSLILNIIIAGFGWHHWMMSYLQGGLFCILIFQVIHHKVLHQKLEKSWLRHLGNISYGIYMWHALVIAVNISFMKRTGMAMDTTGNLILYGITILMTLVISHFSYRLLEQPFLKLKKITPRSFLVKLNLKNKSFG